MTNQNKEVLSWEQLTEAKQEIQNKISSISNPDFKGSFDNISRLIEEKSSFSESQKNMIIDTLNSIDYFIKKWKNEKVKEYLASVQKFITSINYVDKETTDKKIQVSRDSLLSSLKRSLSVWWLTMLEKSVISYVNKLDDNDDYNKYYQNISAAKNPEELKKAFLELKNFVKNWKASTTVNETVTPSDSKSSGVDVDNENNDLKKQNLSEILDIDFNWKYKVNTLKFKLRWLWEKLRNWEFWNDFTLEQRNILIENLEKALENYELTKEISISKLEAYFDDLAKSIKPKWNKFVIEFKDEDWNLKEKVFDTKWEAIDAIRKLKSTSEVYLQNFLRTMLEWVANWLGVILWYTLGKAWKWISYWYWKAFDWLSWWLWYVWDSYKKSFLAMASEDIEMDFWDYVNLASIIPMTIVSSAFIWVHIWAWESVYRRVVQDWYQTRNQNDPRYVLEDFDQTRRRDANWNIEMPEGMADDYKEYQQRQNLMEAIRTKFDNMEPWSPEYQNFAKKVAKLEKFRLNKKTPTFYYLAYKYVTYEWDVWWSFLNSLRNIFHRWAKYPIMIKLPWGDKLDKDWKSTKVEFKDEKWNTHYRNKKWFKIPFYFAPQIDDSKDLYNETIKKLNSETRKLQDGLKSFFPNKHIVNDQFWEFKIIWSDEKSERYTRIANYINNNFSWIERKNKLDKLNKLIDDLKITPKSLDRLELDLYIALETDYLSDKDALNIVKWRIDEIKSRIKLLSKKRFSSIRVFNIWWWKLAKLNHLEKLIKTKQLIWTEAEIRDILADIEKWWGFVKTNYKERIYDKKWDINNRISDIYKTWEKFLEVDIEIKEKIWKDLEAFKKSDFWRWLFSHIDYLVSDSNEKIFRKNINELLEQFYSWDRLFTSAEDFYWEIARSIWLSFSDIDSLFEDLESKAILETNSFKLENLDNYKNQLDWAKILDYLNWKSNVNNELVNLTWKIKSGNKYTNWQISYILTEIINWKQLKSINHLSININEHWNTNVSWIKENDLKQSFQSIINDNSKISDFRDFVKDNNIDIKNLPQELQDRLDTNFEKNRQDLLKILSDLDRIKNEQWLDRLQNRYDKVLEKVDTENPILKQIIDDIDNKIDEFNFDSSTQNPTSSPEKASTPETKEDLETKRKRLENTLDRMEFAIYEDSFNGKGDWGSFLEVYQKNYILILENYKWGDIESYIRDYFKVFNLKESIYRYIHMKPDVFKLTVSDLKQKIDTRRKISFSWDKFNFKYDLSFKGLLKKLKL